MFLSHFWFVKIIRHPVACLLLFYFDPSPYAVADPDIPFGGGGGHEMRLNAKGTVGSFGSTSDMPF